MKNLKLFILIGLAVIVLQACSPAEGDFAGSEYMPDMGHSVAIEANVFNYYYLNTWDSASVLKLKELSNPRLPVKGTIPRGYAGVRFAQNSTAQNAMLDRLNGATSTSEMNVPINGSVPYYYEDTEEERTRAINEIIDNPYPITTAGLDKGEELYTIFCGVCHGEKGDGVGYLVSEDNPNAIYPAAPANFLLDEFINSSNGRYYHSIIYGKNVMGGYADKLSYEERWQVIHYIRSLQAMEKKLEYSEAANTLNSVYGTPGSEFQVLANQISDTDAGQAQEAASEEGEENHEGESHGEENHDGGHK